MDDLEEFRTSLEEITADVAEIRELELEAELEGDWTAVISGENLRRRSYFLWINKVSNILRWNPLLVKVLWRLLKWQKRALEDDINLLGKAVAWFERTDSSFEGSNVVDKVLPSGILCYRKMLVKGRVSSCSRHDCCPILRNCHNYPNLQQPPPWSVSSHQGKTLPQQKDYDSWWLVFFSHKVFFN